MNIWLNLLPVTSAAIGVVVSLLTSSLFFSARVNRRFWERKKLSLANMVTDFLKKDDLLSIVKDNISDADNFNKILPLVEEHIDHFLRVKLKEAMPMIGMLIGDRTINQLKEIFIKELQELFPSVMNAYASQLKDNIDLRQVIAAKILPIPATAIAVLVRKEVAPALIGLGAIIGLAIGSIQWMIFFFTI